MLGLFWDESVLSNFLTCLYTMSSDGGEDNPGLDLPDLKTAQQNLLGVDAAQDQNAHTYVYQPDRSLQGLTVRALAFILIAMSVSKKETFLGRSKLSRRLRTTMTFAT